MVVFKILWNYLDCCYLAFYYYYISLHSCSNLNINAYVVKINFTFRQELNDPFIVNKHIRHVCGNMWSNTRISLHWESSKWTDVKIKEIKCSVFQSLYSSHLIFFFQDSGEAGHCYMSSDWHNRLELIWVLHADWWAHGGWLWLASYIPVALSTWGGPQKTEIPNRPH